MPAVGSPGDDGDCEECDGDDDYDGDDDCDGDCDGDCEDCHGDNDQKKEKVEWKTIENGSEKALTSVFHFHCRNANTNRQTELNVKV